MLRLGQRCYIRAFVEKQERFVGENSDGMELYERVLTTRENPLPERIFTLIHAGYMTETRYPDEDSRDFFHPRETRRKVFFLATGLWRQHRAFPEDIELIEERSGDANS